MNWIENNPNAVNIIHNGIYKVVVIISGRPVAFEAKFPAKSFKGPGAMPLGYYVKREMKNGYLVFTDIKTNTELQFPFSDINNITRIK